MDYPNPSLITAVNEPVKLTEGIATKAGNYKIAAIEPGGVRVRRDGEAWLLCHRVFWRLIDCRPGRSRPIDFPVEVGVLLQLGYRVGERGFPRTNRRAALYRAFTASAATIQGLIPIPSVAEWDEPRSMERVRKMGL